nr:hypothetical protein CFP56_13693 [Quercus suber]
MIESIIKETDLDPCAKQTVEDLGTLGLFDLSKALVHMTVLQDRSVAQESVISRLRKRNETLTNEQEQYKGAFRTLNKEVGSIYLDLDLSKISIDDLVLTTSTGDDTVSEETDDSTQSE